MKKTSTLIFSALAAFTVFAGVQARADNMASIAITPATGVVTLAPHWSIGGSLAGFHLMSQNWGLTGGAANEFYSIKNTAIPAGGDTLAYNFYVAGSGAATPHADIGSKLTPDSYSALTSADPDIGYGPVNQYLIHHRGATDYFTVIKPGAAAASSVTDLRPMSGPGGPSTVTSVSGYFGLTFASANLGYGLNLFYYLRTDPLTGLTKFGTLVPALAGIAADQFDLGIGGHYALAFTGTDVGFGTDKMYYLRRDPITGFTIFGTLHPLTGRAADIANLGSVYTTLTFVPGDVGFGSGQFYTTGAVNPAWQSVSFAAIADRALGAGSFTVNPTASSGLPITLTVVTGSASISAPVGGVFTVTPTAAGLITLQATQAGQLAPTAYEYNMLRQSFRAYGVASTADFNGDGQADILWQNTATGQRALWLMTGPEGGFAPANIINLGFVDTNWTIAGTGDFNADNQTDILWQNTVTGQRALWLMTGPEGGFAPANIINLGFVDTNWVIAGTGDFNADNQTDILWQNTATGQRALWLMTGAQGGFAPANIINLGFVDTNWTIAGTGDFNADNQTDILWQNTVTGQRVIRLMTGAQGGFATTAIIDLGVVDTNWTIAGTGDFNTDNQTDILWQNTVTGQRALWLMTGAQGGFAPASIINLGFVDTNWVIAN